MEDLNEEVSLEIYANAEHSYLYSDQIGCWIKQDVEKDHQQYKVNIYIDEKDVDLTSMIEEGGFYIIQATNIHSKETQDLIDSLTENIGFDIDWNLNDIEMKLYFNQSDCMLSKLTVDHLDCEAEVDGMKQNVSLSLQQKFEVGKLLNAFVKVPDYAVAHAKDQITPLFYQLL